MIWVSPHGFVKAGIESRNATLADRHFAVQGRTLKVVGFTAMGKYRITGEFNDQNLLELISYDPGDVAKHREAGPVR